MRYGRRTVAGKTLSSRSDISRAVEGLRRARYIGIEARGGRRQRHYYNGGRATRRALVRFGLNSRFGWLLRECRGCVEGAPSSRIPISRLDGCALHGQRESAFKKVIAGKSWAKEETKERDFWEGGKQAVGELRQLRAPAGIACRGKQMLH